MRLLCTLTALTLACASAGAQTYPTKSIRWVVPSTPGDGSDVTGRLIADKISRELGQAVVIDNKPGAGGVLGSDAVAKSPADGYTMIVGNAGSHGVNAGIYSKLPYDVVKDFVPVALICTTPNVMVVNPSVKAKDVKDLVRLLKEKPDFYSVASAGNGTAPHFAAELFKIATQTNMLQIPYKGSAPAVNDTIAGQTHVMFPSLFTGVHGNYLAPSVRNAGMDPDNLPESDPSKMDFGGDKSKAWKDIWGCGQGIGAVNKIQTTAAFIDQLKAEYATAKARLLA